MESLKKYFLTILTTLSTAGIIWLLSTTIQLEQDNVLIKYQVEQIHAVLQDLSERGDDER